MPKKLRTDLWRRHCLPHSKLTRLTPGQTAQLRRLLVGDWRVVGGQLKAQFHCHDFLPAVDFLCQVAELADAENHHPTLQVDFDTVGVSLRTNFVKGLSENDFILASKIERLYERRFHG